MFRTTILFIVMFLYAIQIGLARPITPTFARHDSELSFKHVGGGTSRLRDFRGKLVIVHFWATWCGSCMEEMDSLRQLNDRLKGTNAHLLMVSTDFGNEASLQNFMRKNSMEAFDVVLAPTLGSYFDVRGIPTTIFINSVGEEVGRIIGGAHWQSDEIEEQLRKLMEDSQKLFQETAKEEPHV